MHRRRQRGGERLRSTLLLVGLVVMSVFVAVATGSSSSPIAAQDASGADLYEANCAGCHQVGGEGIPGTFPPLAGSPAATDNEYVAVVITDGKTGAIEVLGETYDSAMPAVGGLSDDDLDAIVGHVVELAGGESEPDTPTEPVGPPAPKMTSAPSPMNCSASEAPLAGSLNDSL